MRLRKVIKKTLRFAEAVDRAIVGILSYQKRYRAKPANWLAGASDEELLRLNHRYDAENFDRYVKILKSSVSLRFYLWLRHNTLGHAKRLARRLLR